MNKKFLIIIASCFLFSGACRASLPVKAVVTAKPAASFMQRMPEIIKGTGYLGSAMLLYYASQAITNPIKNYWISSKKLSDKKAEKDEISKERAATKAGEPSYLEQGFDFATSLITGAAINWWALPFFYQQRKHPLHYYLVSSLAFSLLDPIMSRATDFCLAKITNSTRMRLFLSLGLTIPAVAALGHAHEQITYATTRSLTGIKESPALSFKFQILIACIRFIFPLLCHPLMLSQFDEQLDELDKLTSKFDNPKTPVTIKTWEAISAQVDGVASFLADKENSPEQVASKNLLPQQIVVDHKTQMARAYELLRIIDEKINNLSSKEKLPVVQALKEKLEPIFR